MNEKRWIEIKIAIDWNYWEQNSKVPGANTVQTLNYRASSHVSLKLCKVQNEVLKIFEFFFIFYLTIVNFIILKIT